MGPTDDTSFRETELRSTAACFAALGLALSGIAGAMVWLVVSFPVHAAEDVAGVATQVAVLHACAEAASTTTTGAPRQAGPTVPTICASLTTPTTPTAPTTNATAPGR